MNRRKCLFHTAEAGESDCRGDIALLLQVPEQFKAVRAWHDQIRHDDICVEGFEPYQCFQPVGRDLCFNVTLG